MWKTRMSIDEKADIRGKAKPRDKTKKSIDIPSLFNNYCAITQKESTIKINYQN
jgi:hypothetical protein